MGVYIQGDWNFFTASLNAVSPTNVTMSLNDQSGTIQTIKISSTSDCYIAFGKTANSGGFRITATGSFDFDNNIDTKISFLGITAGTASVAYFTNKQVDLSPKI